MRNALRIAALTTTLATLTGCFVAQAQKGVGLIRGDHIVEQPAGIEPGPNGLRLSPCACIQLKTGEGGQVIL